MMHHNLESRKALNAALHGGRYDMSTWHVEAVPQAPPALPPHLTPPMSHHNHHNHHHHAKLIPPFVPVPCFLLTLDPTTAPFHRPPGSAPLAA